MTAKDDLWDLALEQDGLVTTDNARSLGIGSHVLRQLAHRGALEHTATGVYRFATYPYRENTPYREAVLWAGHHPAYLSHETVLDIHHLCDVNPGVIHVTIPAGVRFRRQDPRFKVHQEVLDREDVEWWEEIPAVRPDVAIRQCIEGGLPTYLVRQAVTNAAARRLASPARARQLRRMLEARERG